MYIYSGHSQHPWKNKHSATHHISPVISTGFTHTSTANYLLFKAVFSLHLYVRRDFQGWPAWPLGVETAVRIWAEVRVTLKIPIPTQALLNQACPAQRTGVGRKELQDRCAHLDGMSSSGAWEHSLMADVIFGDCSQSWCDVGGKCSCDLSQVGLLRQPQASSAPVQEQHPTTERCPGQALMQGPILGGSCMDKQPAQLRARAQFLPSVMEGLLPGQTCPHCHPAFSLSRVVPNSPFLCFLRFKNLLFNISTVIIELKPSHFQLHSR